MTYPPRPQWNHPEAKTLAAKECVDEVRAWASATGAEEGDPKEFLAVLALALQESPDAYAAGRYLEEFVGWKVNGDLIRILDRAYGRCKFVLAPLVHEWVMVHKVRFPAKKDQAVFCRIGDFEFKGRVVAVIKREAKGIVEPLGRPGKSLSVNAEEVIQVLNTGKAEGPGNFPTGGTPVAGAMQVPVKNKVNE